MRCICGNYGCIGFFFLIKSNFDYTRFIKFVVVPKRGSEWRGLAPAPKKRRSGCEPLATLCPT